MFKNPVSPLEPNEAEALAAQHIPSFFTGKENYNPAIVQAYRDFSHHKQAHIAVRQYLKEITPLVKTLTDHIKSEYPIPTTIPKLAQQFLDEIKQHETNNTVSGMWILDVHLRYAVANHQFAPDEYDLIRHLIDHRIVEELRNNIPWPWRFYTPETVLANEHYEPAIKFYSPNLHSNVYALIDAAMDKLFPGPVYYPFAGLDKFGISFLVSCYLNRVFPLALPRRDKGKLLAHSAKLSRAAFIIHDALHGDTDPRPASLKDLIAGTTSDFVANGGSALDFIQFYTPIAIAQYKAFISCLNSIHSAFLSQLLPYRGQTEFKKAMVGFFFMVHEYPPYQPQDYVNNDLSSVLQALVSRSKKALRSEEAWESPTDPLKTSPIDGQSSLTDEQILQYTFHHNLMQDNVLLNLDYYKIYPLPDKEQYIATLIHRTSVTKSPRFIDVTFEMKTGETKTYSYTTLFFKWLNIHDSLALLKMADVNLPKPNISGLKVTESRKVVQKTLRTVRNELETLLDHFKNRAIFFADKKAENGESLSDRYFLFQFKAQSKVYEETTKALLKPKI